MTARKPYGSRLAAINAFCKGCIYDKTQPGNWRQQVEACTSKSCALFDFRPVSTPEATPETNGTE